MSQVVSLEEALLRVEAHVRAKGEGVVTPEIVPLAESLGRVLAGPVRADRDQPPFARSTRDGFAVRSVDCAGVPCVLRCVGEVAAGTAFAGEVAAGQCVEIMTGAPLPAGADAVVMIEHTMREGDAIRVLQVPASGENVVPRGSEARAGAVVLSPGTWLGPAAIGVLAQVGVAQTAVRPRPRVAVLTTGDELVAVEQVPGASQIRNSNLHALAARVRQAGGEPVCLPVVDDNPARLRLMLADAFGQTDLVLITGGVSKGKHDHVKAVLGELGARIHVAGVAIRPGKPVVFGTLGDGDAARPFFGLPGNPVSVLVTFELLVRPALARLQNRTPGSTGWLKARLATAYQQKALSLHALVPARLQGGPLGETLIVPLPWQGSGDLVALAAAQALLSVAPGVARLEPDTLVDFLPL